MEFIPLCFSKSQRSRLRDTRAPNILRSSLDTPFLPILSQLLETQIYPGSDTRIIFLSRDLPPPTFRRNVVSYISRACSRNVGERQRAVWKTNRFESFISFILVQYVPNFRSLILQLSRGLVTRGIYLQRVATCKSTLNLRFPFCVPARTSRRRPNAARSVFRDSIARYSPERALRSQWRPMRPCIFKSIIIM